MDRTHDKDLSWIDSNRQLLVNRKGFHVYMEETIKDRKTPINLKGFALMEMADLLPYIFTERDYLAIWKLRSVQSIRDHIFIQVTGHEHEGKEGIRKSRIRGYRDGKASPRDPTLTRMAREVDRTFYEERYQTQWDELEMELKRYSSS